jgi:DNA-directed RNA polymerase specialized sigma24 family protein
MAWEQAFLNWHELRIQRGEGSLVVPAEHLAWEEFLVDSISYFRKLFRSESPENVEDLLQDFYLTVFIQTPSQYDRDQGEPGPYLKTIAKNALRMFWRQKDTHRAAMTSVYAGVEGGEQFGSDHEDPRLQGLRACLNRLLHDHPVSGKVVIYWAESGLKLPEVAKKLGYSLQKTTKALKKARYHLGTCISKWKDKPAE